MPANPDTDPQVTPTPAPDSAARELEPSELSDDTGTRSARVRLARQVPARRSRPEPTRCSEGHASSRRGCPAAPTAGSAATALQASTRLPGHLRRRGRRPGRHERGGRRCSQSGAAPPAGCGARRAVAHVGPIVIANPFDAAGTVHLACSVTHTWDCRPTSAVSTCHASVTCWPNSRDSRMRRFTRARGPVVRARGRGPAVRHGRRHRERRPVVRRTRRRRVPAASIEHLTLSADARHRDDARRPTQHRVQPHHRRVRVQQITGTPSRRRRTSAADAAPGHTNGATRGSPSLRAPRRFHSTLLATVDRVVVRCQNTLPRFISAPCGASRPSRAAVPGDVLRDLLAAATG